MRMKPRKQNRLPNISIRKNFIWELAALIMEELKAKQGMVRKSDVNHSRNP